MGVPLSKKILLALVDTVSKNLEPNHSGTDHSSSQLMGKAARVRNTQVTFQ